MSAATTPRPAAVSPPVAQIKQGIIEEARRRRSRRRLRSAAAAVTLALLAGVVLAAARGGTKNAGAPPRRPPEPPPIGAQPIAGRPHDLGLQLSPDIRGGQAGWCVLVIEPSGGSGGTCPPLPTRSHPALGGETGWSNGEPDATTVDVVGPRVAYVIADGNRKVIPSPLFGLPYGFRAVIVHTPYKPGRERRMHIPTVITFDASGNRLIESVDLGSGLAVKEWNPPSAPANGACSLSAASLTGLKTEWGQVATALHPYAGAIVGRGFLSCISTEYYVHGHGLTAAVLLDAAGPGRVVPGAIPGLAPVPGAPGLYSSDSRYGFSGPMTAKRRGDAWIVVAGGGRDAGESRVRLLQHLNYTIRP